MAHRRFALLLGMLLLLPATGCDYLRTEADCTADLDAMHDAVAMALGQGTSCRQDSDCVEMDVSNLCYGACPVAVHRADADFVVEAVEEAEAAFCPGFMEQCGYTTPQCPARTPVCRQGLCEMAEPLYLYLVAPTL